jgi:ATP phosphoribosyltransferase
MKKTMKTIEKNRIFLPKNAFNPKSKNYLGDIFHDAGYDKVNGDFDSKDQIPQGDFIFCGIKGSEALSTQFELYQQSPIGLVFGEDILAEAFFLSQQQDNNNMLMKILNMHIGPCKLQFLSPKENMLKNIKDLKTRTIFTKYPEITKKLISSLGISNFTIKKTNGSDTRIGEYRERNKLNTAALEIVDTGNTARKNGLEIQEDNCFYPNLGEIEISSQSIATNYYVCAQTKDFSLAYREKFAELGVGLESALKKNRYTSLSFNIPQSMTHYFQNIGLKGPSCKKILSSKKEIYQELTILVPSDETNETMCFIIEKGGEDIAVKRNIEVAFSGGQSEVIEKLYPKK